MTFSTTSTLITVVLANLLIFLCAFILRSKKIIYRISYNVPAALILFIMIRMLFPFSFDKSRTIELPKCCSVFLSAIQDYRFHIGNLYFCAFDLLCLIWLAGILLMAFHVISRRRIIHRYIKAFGRDISSEEPYTSEMTKLCRCNRLKNRIRIFTVPGIPTPLICGVIKPCILLPEGMTLKDKELHYILMHEVSHYIHGDTLTKNLLQLITILFWWNPACHILNKEANLLFELRVDKRLVRENKASMHEYLQCILNIAEQSLDIPAFTASPCIGFASKEDNSALQKRIYYMIEKKGTETKILNLVIMAISFVLVFFSYLYTPRTTDIANDEAYFELTPENAYFIQNEDGSYDIYYLDYYTETVSSLRGYDTEIPVYQGKEEFNHESEKAIVQGN